MSDRLRNIFGMMCLLLVCIYLYSDELVVIPEYLRINRIIGAGNMTSTQNVTGKNHSNDRAKINVKNMFRNDSYCMNQRKSLQQIAVSNKTSSSKNHSVTGSILKTKTGDETVIKSAQKILNSNNTAATSAPKLQESNKIVTVTAQKIQYSNKTVSTHAKKVQNSNGTASNTTRNQRNIYFSCPGLHKPDIKNETQKFQPVNQQAYVFSAYYDHRLPRPTIKIVAMSHVSHRDELLLCQMWYKESCEPDTRQVSGVETHAHFPQLQSTTAKLLSCVLPDDRVPYAVSIVANKCQPLNVLSVINNYRRYKDKPKYQFTVCGPVLANFNNFHELVNMIEINMIFGAEKFVFFDHSLQGEAKMYLKKYQEEGKVDLIDFKLPAGMRVYFFAQSNAILECQYRNMYKSKYIAYFDTDEIIVPKYFQNWSQIMLNLTGEGKPKMCAASFEGVFFRGELPQPRVLSEMDEKTVKEYHITPLSVTIREIIIGGHNKWIGDPLRMIMGSVHTPQKCSLNATIYNVAVSIGFMHHYRKRPYYPGRKTQQDTSFLKHKDEILKRVVARHKKFKPEPTTIAPQTSTKENF